MAATSKLRRGTGRAARLVFLASFAFYALGMARGVATDDSAELQNLAPDMLRLHAPGYPLQWLLIRSATVASPMTDATTVTLLSPLAAALALAMLFAAVTRLTGEPVNGLATAVILGVSHTFWMQASLPEVYALNAAFLALSLYLLAKAIDRPALASRCLLATAFAIGVGAGNHLTLALMGAALAPTYLVWFPRTRRLRILLLAAALGLAGLVSVYGVMAVRFAQIPDDPLLADPERAPWQIALWWAMGGPAQQELFVFGPAALAKRLAVFTGYFFYQFISPALILALAGGVIAWNRARYRPWLAAAAGIWLITVVYGVNFDSSDVFVFYIPAYLATAALAGIAFRKAAEITEGLVPGEPRTALLVLCVALPVFWYALIPVFLNDRGIFLSEDKGNIYYLWPPKAGSFRTWDEQAIALLRTVPPGGIILTDWNYLHLLGYYERRPEERRSAQRHRIVNIERDGSINVGRNWSSFSLHHLMLHPGDRIYTLGYVPGIGPDPLFRHFGAPGFAVVELGVVPYVGNADYELYGYLFELLNQRFEQGVAPPRIQNSIELKPFYREQGRTVRWAFNDQALSAYMGISGKSFPEPYASMSSVPRPAPQPDEVPPSEMPPNWPENRPPIFLR